MDVVTPPTFVFDESNSTSDGYHIFIDKAPSVAEVPVHVPSGMEALIVLAEPKKINELTGCRSKAKSLHYFPYDDYNGIGCYAEIIIDETLRQLGCLIALGNYAPINGSCPAAIIPTAYWAITDSDVFANLQKTVANNGGQAIFDAVSNEKNYMF